MLFFPFYLHRIICAVFFLGQIRHIAAAIAAHKSVSVGAGRAHLFAALGAYAVVVGVNFVVAFAAFHSFSPHNKCCQLTKFYLYCNKKNVKFSKGLQRQAQYAILNLKRS